MKALLTNVLFRLLGGNVAEKALSYLPANGKKTIISTLLLAVQIVIAMATGNEWALRDTFIWLQTFLESQHPAVLLDPTEIALLVNGCVIIISVYHKILKALKRAYEQEAIIDSASSEVGV